MTRLRCLLAALLVALPLLVSQAGPAMACTCRELPVKEGLADSDGAFVGVLVESVPRSRPVNHDPFQPDLQRLEHRAVANHFEVQRVVKGEIGGRVEVLAPVSGASCGMEESLGKRVGVFLHRDVDAWVSSMCHKSDPDALLAVATEADNASPAFSTEKVLLLASGLGLLAIPIGLATRRSVRRRA